MATQSIQNATGANIRTGILEVPEVTINAIDNTTYDFGAGSAYFLDLTNPRIPSFEIVRWEDGEFVGLSPTVAASDGSTWISIDKDKNVLNTSMPLSDPLTHQYAELGVVVASAGLGSPLVLKAETPNLAFGLGYSVQSYINARGGFAVSGNNMQAVGSNLQFKFDDTTIFQLGRNAINSIMNTDRTTVPGQDPVATYFLQYRDGAGGFSSDFILTGLINPNVYDDGTGILATVPDDYWTVQEVFLDATGVVVVVAGQYLFRNLSTAVTVLPSLQRTQVINSNLNEISPLGFIIVKKNAVDLGDPSEALVLPVPANLSDLIDINNVVQPIIDRLDESLRPRKVGYYTMTNNATATVISAINTPVKVAGITVNSTETTGFTHANNRLTYEGAFTRDFKVSSIMTFSSGNNNQIGMYITKNGVVIGESETYATAGLAGRFENATVQTVVAMDEGDYLEVWIENATAVTNVTVEFLSTSVITAS